MNFSAYTIKKAEEILSEFSTSLETGLSMERIVANQKKYGFNEIKAKRVSSWEILFRQLKSSFIYLLLVAAAIALLLGEVIDAVAIFLFIFINTIIGFYQEYHSEKTVQLLKKYLVSKTKVRRNGKEQIINSKELVPGDIVILETGDRIPADIRFLKDHNLMVDESALTGESVPVQKEGKILNKPVTEIYAASNIGFSATTVVSGQGEGVIFATGKLAVIGEVAQLTSETIRESSFEKEVRKLSTFILKMVAVTLTLIFVANIFINRNNTNIADLLIFFIALAVSVIPEALPVVMTFSLSRGAGRLAKNKVVVKRLSAIEDLGGIKVLCTDKTGTITENKLAIADIYAESRQETLFYAGLGSSVLREELKNSANSFDAAILASQSFRQKKELKKFQPISEIPFDPQRRKNSVLIREGERYQLIVRGAPEAILKFCKNISAAEIKKINQWLTKMGKQGKRILAIAKKEYFANANYQIADEESSLDFSGLISFTDPIKPSTKKAVKEAEKLGIKIKILTGDSPEVAGAVARQVGITKSAQAVLTGEQLEKMSPQKQQRAVQNFSVFARVSPAQKYKIVQLIKEKTEVGFLGEGINDAPALKIADVALVVDSACDLAKDTADILLLKKSLEVIVDGIKEGREVFANTFKYIKSTLASNFGNFYAVSIISLLIDFLPMLPIQILLLNLLSDFPMIAIATDNVDTAELQEPQSYNLKEVALSATLLGLVSTVFDFIFFALFYLSGPEVLRTNWFVGSILTELVLIFSIRTRFIFYQTKKPSSILFWLSALAVVFTIGIPFTKWGQTLFRFIPPTSYQLLLIFIVVSAYFVVTETVKNFYYRFTNHNRQLKPAS